MVLVNTFVTTITDTINTFGMKAVIKFILTNFIIITILWCIVAYILYRIDKMFARNLKQLPLTIHKKNNKPVTIIRILLLSLFSVFQFIWELIYYEYPYLIRELPLATAIIIAAIVIFITFRNKKLSNIKKEQHGEIEK